MSAQPPSDQGEGAGDGYVATAVLGILAATALELAIAALGLVPDSTPVSQLQDYLNHTVAFQEYAGASAAFLILGILFVAAVGVFLRRSNRLGGALSTAIWSVGILVLTVSAVLWVGVLGSIQAASGSAPTMADQTYQAAVANGLIDALTEVGWTTFAIGFFLSAWLARRSRLVPGWLGVAGMVGGVGSLPIGPLPEFVGTTLFSVWAFGIAALLVWQRRVAVGSFGIGSTAIGVGWIVVGRIGGAVSAPLVQLMDNTPVPFFYIATGIALIWLSRGVRTGVQVHTSGLAPP